MDIPGLDITMPKLTLVMLVTGMLLIFLTVVMHAAFVYMASAVAGIQGRSFSKAFAATLVYLLCLTFALVCVWLFVGPGTGLGMLVGFFILALVVRNFFETTLGRAFAAAALTTFLGYAFAIGMLLLFLLMVGGAIAFEKV